MVPYMKEFFGNPSSVHAFGRKSRAGVEMARKTIARHLNCQPSEIYFTSGGTEADNMAIMCSIRDLGVRHAITSPIEHKAVLETLKLANSEGKVKLSIVNLTDDGSVDIEHLRKLLGSSREKTLVSLMHANNEISNRIPLKEIGELCKEHKAVFHSDTVQTMGHYPFDLQELHVDFITGSAHKFHGPKGVGFLFVRNNNSVNAMITGGGQERSKRAGTEYTYGIVGLAKALDLAFTHCEEHRAHIEGLKAHMVDRLEEEIPGVSFNGRCTKDGLYTVLSVCLPESERADMMLYTLDLFGVAASGGSACSSGASTGSHVLTAMGIDQTRPNIRFSFSRFNTIEEIDYAVEQVKKLYPVHV